MRCHRDSPALSRRLAARARPGLSGPRCGPVNRPLIAPARRPIPPRSSSSRRRSGRFSPSAARDATAPSEAKGEAAAGLARSRCWRGATGPAVAPGQPEKSLLIDAINYGELYQMPPKSKLPAERDRHAHPMGQGGSGLGRRVAAGSRQGGSADTRARHQITGLDTPGEFQRRARHWSFQPIRRTAPPAASARHAGWAAQPDRSVPARGAWNDRDCRRRPRPTGEP